MRSLNLMRALSGLHCGADQETLMRVYLMVIRSKLDSGSSVYGSASNVLLNSLEVVQNEAIRIATGVFKSTRVDDL